MVLVTRAEHFDGWDVFEYIETDDEDDDHLEAPSFVPCTRKRQLFVDATDKMRLLKLRKGSGDGQAPAKDTGVTLLEEDHFATTSASLLNGSHVNLMSRNEATCEKLRSPSSDLVPNLNKQADVSTTVGNKPITQTETAPTSATAMTQPQSRFLNLPDDLIYHLSDHLTYNTLLALRSTCHKLHNVLTVDHVTTIRTRFILNCLADEAVQRAEYRRIHPRYGRDTLWDLFSIAFEWQLLERPVSELRCYGCLEVKPLRMFVERMSCKGTGLGGRLARQRRCKDCMRQHMFIAGTWWREHWLRRSEMVRRAGAVERHVSRLVRGKSLPKVAKGEEVGICVECGTGQFELYWGCAMCFEKEQLTRRREEWSMMGFEDTEELEGWVKWVLQKHESWTGRRDKRRKQRFARRAESGGKWWNVRRYAVWMGIDVRWKGSWAERVESLVDHLEESYQRRAAQRLQGSSGAGHSIVEAGGEDAADSDEIDGRHPPSQGELIENSQNPPRRDWRPTDEITDPTHPFYNIVHHRANDPALNATNKKPRDRLEVRCAMCWTPSCRRRRCLGGLVSAWRKLELERCCEMCQAEEAIKAKRRGKKEKMEERKGVMELDEEVGLEGLFAEEQEAA
ncbi:uncharacterized protein AB675_9681 [Cyphellophora attinorum]|uniref:F-box domain-containing protein n=1 Tax=Cyphellophora attinorum TaxID=1664694 RepID=A0A0N1P2K9_9EURO|nr:uncharacterized protein AB675_9681 [Phialophora attinorum]KPI42596.1 hypothetical protein AB675_9681 [Phialophora attinorum]